MFVRVYFLLRAIFNYSMYTDTYAKKLCRNYGVSANVRFSFKCLLIRYPGQTIVMTFSLSVLIIAYLLRIFELPYNFAVKTEDFDTYFSAIWCVVMSVTTVGYGDTVPFTVLEGA